MNTLLTPDQVKENFRNQGKSFMKFAHENGYRPQQVYQVLNGQAKGRFGKAHEIAVKLGMKNEEPANLQS